MSGYRPRIGGFSERLAAAVPRRTIAVVDRGIIGRVPARNRVTPFGDIVAIPGRGTYMGNRGCIHRGHSVVRPWATRRWITCVLTYKDWRAPMWQPNRWTALFFADEAVALAAGHRPCALCRRADYERWRDAWQSAFGRRAGADEMDLRLHSDRVDEARRPRRHDAAWADLPRGAFVALGDGRAARIDDRGITPWTSAGYGEPERRPALGTVTVLTPRATVSVLRNGYVPDVSGIPSASDGTR